MNEDFIRKMRDEIKQKEYDNSFKNVFDTYAFDFVLTVMAVFTVGLLILTFLVLSGGWF